MQLSHNLDGLQNKFKSAVHVPQDMVKFPTVKKTSGGEDNICLKQGVRSRRDELVKGDDTALLPKQECIEAETGPSTCEVWYHKPTRKDDDTVQSSESSAKIKFFEELAIQTPPPKQKLEKVFVQPLTTNDVCDTPVEKVDNTQGLESAEKYKLVKELADLREKLSEANTDLACLRKERLSFRTAISETRKNIDTSKIEVMNFKDHFDRDKKAAKKLSLLFDSMTTENENLSKENDKQAKKIKLLHAAKQEKKPLSSEVAVARNDLGHVIINWESLHKKRASLELTIENVLEMWSTFSKERANLNRRLVKMTKELAKMKRGVSHLKQTVEDGKVSLKQSTTEMLAARVQNRRLMQKIARHEDQIKSAEQENENLSEQLLKLGEKVEECTAEIQSFCKMALSLEENLNNVKNETSESENVKARLVQTAGAPTTDFVASETKNEKLLAKKKRQKDTRDIVEISAIKFERDKLAAKLRKELEAADAAKVQLRAMGEDLNEQKITNKKLEDALEHEFDSKCADGLTGSRTSGEIDDSTACNNETLETNVISAESTEGDEEAQKETTIAHLQDTISSLKAELKEVRSPAKAEKDHIAKNTKVEKHSSKKLLVQDNDTKENNRGQTSGMETVDKQDSPTYGKQKLLDSILIKDEEIKGLRREIAVLREQFDFDLSTVSSLSDTLSGMKPTYIQRTGFPPLECAYNKEVVELHSVKNKLEKELEEVRIERDQLIRTIEAERKDATNELTAFAIALKGADELHVAAEQMSTEITRLNNLKDDGGARSEDSGNEREPLQKFKCTIQKATLQSKQKDLWKQLRLNEKVREKTMDSANGAAGHHGKNGDDDRTTSSSFFLKSSSVPGSVG